MGYDTICDCACLFTSRSEVLTERDIPSLGVRTGGWVEVDVSVVAAAAVALGFVSFIFIYYFDAHFLFSYYFNFHQRE